MNAKLNHVQSELDSLRCLLQSEKSQLADLKENIKPILGEITKKRVSWNTSSNPVNPVSSVNHDGSFGGQIAHLSISEFDALPKYLRGRLPLSKINAFIDDLNRICTDKYTLLARTNLAKLSVDQRQKVAEWRSAELDDLADKFFITEADLKAKSAANGAFKYDQVARNILTILRQVGRIKESRSAGIIRYIFNQ